MKRIYDYICYFLTFIMLFSFSLFIINLIIKIALPILFMYNYTKLIILIINLVFVTYIMFKFYNISTHRLF